MAKMPGLHITIGHVERDEPEMVFALSVGEQSFDVKRESIIDEDITVNKFGYDTMPPYWPKFVKRGSAPWGATGTTTSHTWTRTANGGGWRKSQPKKPTYHRENTNLADRWDQQAWGWGEDLALLPELDTPSSDTYKTNDPFSEHADIVEMATEQMQDITAWLNSYGFSVGYNLTYNVDRAEKQLAIYNERMSQDDAPTP
jgi:hypothetical protein